MRAAVASIVLAAAVAAGCGLGAGAPVIPSTGCANVPAAVCDEQAQRVTAGLSGIESVEIDCGGAAPCTRAGGSGLAEIRFSDGRKLTRAWSYVGDVGPAPVVACVGVPRAPCQSAADGEIDDISPSKHVAAVMVTCTSAQCTAAAGSVTVHIVFGDGSSEDHGSAWSTGSG